MAVEYELVDAGDGRRLERFGARLVDRPAATAVLARRDPARWGAADARFDRPSAGAARDGWTTTGPADPWPIELDGIELELRYASGGQVGLFPEHLMRRQWLEESIARAAAKARGVEGRPPEPPAVLNLFAYTGALTIVAARAGAAVAHVDAARGAVAWARRNAELSGVADCPIRWLVEDAERFVRREATRGRRYAGVVLDPPSFGHGPDGRRWRLEERLEPLVSAACALLDGPVPFALLTTHTRDVHPDSLAAVLGPALGEPIRAVEFGPLELIAPTGARLELGAFAAWRFG